MRNPAQLFALLNELIFVLVGAILLWVALAGRYFFNPRQTGWLVVSVVLVLWGLRTWRRAGVAGMRAVAKIGGGSLAAVGLIFLSLAWAPFQWVGVLLALAGTVFVLRGLAAAAILAFSS
jgi:hypothetical protein